MRFEALGLAEPILRAIDAEGYTTPTPIQIKAIPHVLAGSDLLGCAQTGTGKTAAFALPILHKLGSKPAHAGSHGRRPIHALILCPTRELASQIADSFRAYGRNVQLKHTVVFGGVSQHHQVKSLKAGVDVLIATPGRLLDLMNQGFIDLRAVEILVLDEADRMLDMGFIHDIRKIVKHIPVKRQTLLFSATMPSDIRHLAASILHNPVNVAVNPVSSTVEKVSQSVYFVQRKNKPALLTHLLRNNGIHRTLVFTRTKHGADKVVKVLLREGINAQAIHGNKSQNARTAALRSFKSHTPPVLVATDIASRGIDVDDITHVINFDIPNVPETYVHRIGRTARAGASGAAVSFCDPGEERGDLTAIERLIRTQIPVNTDVPMFAQPAPGAGPGPDRHHSRADRSPQRDQSRGRRWSKPAVRPSPEKSRAAHSAHHTNGEAQGTPTGARRGFQQRGRGRGRKGSGIR